MNSTRKGQQFCREICASARARGLEAETVPMSGHLGRRHGGNPYDLAIADYRIEAKRYKGGIGSKAVEDILTGDQGVTAVAHQSDRGIALITLGLEDFLDLLAKAHGRW